jgi:hypothetical protein
MPSSSDVREDAVERPRTAPPVNENHPRSSQAGSLERGSLGRNRDPLRPCIDDCQGRQQPRIVATSRDGADSAKTWLPTEQRSKATAAYVPLTIRDTALSTTLHNSYRGRLADAWSMGLLARTRSSEGAFLSGYEEFVLAHHLS